MLLLLQKALPKADPLAKKRKLEQGESTKLSFYHVNGDVFQTKIFTFLHQKFSFLI